MPLNFRLSVFAAVAAILLVQSGTFAQDALEIVRRADSHLRGKTRYSEMTMKVVRPDWSREISMKAWEKGHDLSLVLITSPARDRGITFLKRGTEMWNWLPAVEKIIKIPPSMMMQSWMGSDFTNDDLVKESSMVEDYTHRIVGDSTIADRACYKIELIPKPEAAVVWGKLYAWITKQDDLELRTEFFDEDDELVNVLKMSEVKLMGGRLLPTVMVMTPVGKEGQRTEMKMLKVEFNIPLKDSFFSEQNLKRVR